MEGQKPAGIEISALDMCYQLWRAGRNCSGARSTIAVFNDILLWRLRHLWFISGKCDYLTCCAHPPSEGQPLGQSKPSSWHQVSQKTLVMTPSAFPFFFPAVFIKHISPLGNVALDEACSSSWPCKGAVRLVLACSSVPL